MQPRNATTHLPEPGVLWLGAGFSLYSSGYARSRIHTFKAMSVRCLAYHTEMDMQYQQSSFPDRSDRQAVASMERGLCEGRRVRHMF